ncbi:Bug family tripartite tricarboxylate transporter substrate binding protein [Paracraurococcus lichenis]|uniref:Tripartite tricarboxylate transporter substrate binding protein n=1 Tax=Paracraurococcus lichenis TaxID=3064888 RepID=A0ABT9DSG8_9PROT|nr:tripartite tricarboxylate transporter substrate binding protein [Paracraurococcus sp. LOR1-02]MDO9706844.1 tripartite tricarboxylate transporter substrate binding protein [Paracraurococcus sp. LOR1-02]
MTSPIIGRRAALAGAILLPGLARGALPDRPLRILLGFAAGSGPDLLARLVADALKEALPAGVVVDNRPGAGGLIAAQEVARTAPADGSTLLLGEVGQLAMAPSTYARLPYDPAKDFAAVAQLASADFAFVVPASVPADDLDGYIRWGKGQAQLTMGTFGAGTPGHFGAAMLGAAAGLAVEPVHFRSTGDAVGAVLNGTVQGMFGSVAVAAPHVKAGRLKALAVTGPVRSPVLPDVPTMAELGRPSLSFSAWFGLVAPAATPAPVLEATEAAVLRALAAPALIARLQEAGFRPSPAGRTAFAALMREETARWAEVVRATGFKAIE